MESFKVKGYKPKLTENLTDGDCYYSAIYRSAKYHRLLNRLFECLRIPIDSEKGFIKGLRELVAASIEGGDARSSYESYKENFENDLETLELQIENSPDYLQEFINKKIVEKEKSKKVKFYSYEEYAKELSNHIKQHNTWAGELEVLLVKNILESCHIILDFYSSNKGGAPPKILPMKVGDYFYIYLYNYREIHWKHYKLVGELQKTRLKRNTRKNITYTRWANNTRNNNNSNTNSNTNSNSNTSNNSNNENIKKIIKLMKEKL